MTPREILRGLFNEEWRTTTILTIVGCIVIAGGTRIFHWPGTVGGTLTCILVGVAAWMHAGKSMDIRDRARERERREPEQRQSPAT